MKVSMQISHASPISENEFKLFNHLFFIPYETKIKANNVKISITLKEINDISGVHFTMRKHNEIALMSIENINDNEIVLDVAKKAQVMSLLSRLRGVSAHIDAIKKITRDGKNFYLLSNIYANTKIMLRGIIACELVSDFAHSLYERVLENLAK